MKKILIVFLFAVGGLVAYVSTYGWQTKRASVTVHAESQEGISRAVKGHVVALSERIGWRHFDYFDNLEATAQYISARLSEYGLSVSRHELSVNGKSVSNLIAELPGTERPEDIILIGAHYDSYFNPGANSNASGVAALLELARLMSARRPALTVRFAAFVNGEPPFFATDLMGSLAYARHIKSLNENVRAVIILDSLGYYSEVPNSQRYPPFWGMFYPNKANFIMVVGARASFSLMNALTSAMREHMSLAVESTVGYDFIESDHWAFWKEGYCTVLITDTGPYRNPHYRSLSDMPEKLNYSNIAQIVAGLRAAVAAYAP